MIEKLKLRIDFVSDVSCPWCIIGLRSLEIALERTRDRIDADLHFQPFELNPQMPPEGENIVEHIAHKYGSTPEQSEAARKTMRARADALGFTMSMTAESRIYNTFDSHRLLHWASLEWRQLALKHALFSAYFSQGQNISDHAVLVDAAAAAGLDPDSARSILSSGEYSGEVREAEHRWTSRGVSAVPAIILDGRHLISGGQLPEVFEQALNHLVESTTILVGQQ